MDLKNGEIHESGVSDTKLYRKLLFTNHRIAMDAQQFSLQQSGLGVQRSDRELSAPDMLAIVDSLKQIRLRYFANFQRTTNKFFLGDSFAKPFQGNILRSQAPADKYSNLIERVKNIKNEVLSSFLQVDFVDKEIDKYMVEVHKKYSIPAACIIFILLGAPLGVITRKGGFGMAASVSLFFFLIYWASLIGGEKLADRGFMTPFWGMWSANILMGIVGALLTYKVAKETVTLDFSFFKKFIPKTWQQPEEAT